MVQRAAAATGLAVIHSNRLESLRSVLVQWIRRNPLDVLENEVVLVQSSGIAQWLHQALAQAADDPDQPGCGIAAALDIQLPSAFLWQAYRAVLGAEQIPKTSPYDKSRLVWRLLRLLPGLLQEPEFQPLARFLKQDESARKEYQLAERLADLFDQYQVYRADWLSAWASGQDVLPDVSAGEGEGKELPKEQRWQPMLWRAIRADLDESQRYLSRADLHRQFLNSCKACTSRPAGLPQRLIVFGISALPQQFIEALAALSRYTQVLLCVHNPCRYYWADIIEDRELLRAKRRRQALKSGMPETLSEAELYRHAHPLLAAWGKQGRDYIRLLDQFDDPSLYRDLFDRVDLFDDVQNVDALPLLKQIQQDILELEPLPDTPRLCQDTDRSLVFHIAHSRQREVEILHDQLLDWFQQDPELKPRDIIVMVPDVNQYAPHIRAVFGRFQREDPRYIPFTLSDQQNRGQAPLLIALEMLLRLPQERFGVSQLFDLLEVPALRARFGVNEGDLPLLQRWIRASGIRWGLDARQRAGLDLPEGLEQNTWLFGLRRMLLGYLMGEGQTFAEIEAYGEVGGLDAARAGPLAELLNALLELREQLTRPRDYTEWGQLLADLLERFLQPASDRDLVLLERLTLRLQQWQECCAEAGLDRPLPLDVVRESWLEGIDEHSLSQRFLAGAVNISTLMPMRAIPFRRICLLGMNDGEYPRQQPPMGFDLMAGNYRPGDRSRREDDRYLFLEALLSARESLYISWIGRDVRDNTEQPPSVLVAQLRDHIQQGWKAVDGDGKALLSRLTTEHPLQPFSPAYFAGDPRLFTYASEWREMHNAVTSSEPAVLPPLEELPAVDIQILQRFLRYPVRTFFNQRLGVWFEALEEAQEEHEPFGFNALDHYLLGQELIAAGLGTETPEEGIEQQQARWRRAGILPLGGYGNKAVRGIVSAATATLRHLQQQRADWVPLSQPLELRLDLQLGSGTQVLEDWVGELYQRSSSGGKELALIVPTPQAVSENEAPRWHQLVRVWVKHLAVSAAGHRISTWLVGPDTSACIRPLETLDAQEKLCTLLTHYRKALQQPAPLACRTALTLLTARDDQDPVALAHSRYAGDSRNPGEVGRDRYLQRAWPEFDTLLSAGLEDWAEALYRPLIDQAELVQKER